MIIQKRKPLKVGARVKIKNILAPVRHRAGKLYGVVTHINGGYIYVRPMWCKWEAQCYPCELEVQ